MGRLQHIPTFELMFELVERVRGAGARDYHFIDYIQGEIDKWRVENEPRGGGLIGELMENELFKRFANKLDECQWGRVVKYLPRAIGGGFVAVSEGNLVWHKMKAGNNGGLVELAGFVKLLLNFDGLHKIPYKVTGQLFGVERLDRAVNYLLDSKRFDDIMEFLNKSIFYD